MHSGWIRVIAALQEESELLQWDEQNIMILGRTGLQL